MLTMALTGHRPQRLKYSSYLETDDWRPIIDWLKQQIKELGVTDAISGMAEGSDCVYAGHMSGCNDYLNRVIRKLDLRDYYKEENCAN